MAISNQGFRVDLNLAENENDTQALNNLGGAGIANDLRVIQNNLRNTDVLTFQFTNTNSVTLNLDTLSTDGYYDDADGFFHFPNNDFVYTNGDRIAFDGIISVPGNGQVVFTPSESYEVINSNGVNKFQLALKGNTTPVTVPANLNYTGVKLIRDNSVSIENTKNFIRPELLSGYDYISGDSINDFFESVQNRNDFAQYDVTRKYRTTKNTETTDEIKLEGSVVVSDPGQSNTSISAVNADDSPGVFIGETRAFSTDNNPWAKGGTAGDPNASLATDSHKVTVADLIIDAVANPNVTGEKGTKGSIIIEGLVESLDYRINVNSDPQDFTHKLPIVINGETYYMLMRST
jgi:hypothetical protein